MIKIAAPLHPIVTLTLLSRQSPAISKTIVIHREGTVTIVKPATITHNELPEAIRKATLTEAELSTLL
jgi:hypothetical protein